MRPGVDHEVGLSVSRESFPDAREMFHVFTRSLYMCARRTKEPPCFDPMDSMTERY